MRQLRLFESGHKDKYSTSDPKSQELDIALLKLIAVGCLPISIVESPPLRELLELVHPRYNCKDHKYMTALLESEYARRFVTLKV
jgi:hypothetical protein